MIVTLVYQFFCIFITPKKKKNIKESRISFKQTMKIIPD